MGVCFHCTPMPVLKMLHILYSCVNLCIVFDKKHSTMGKFPAKQLKLCGFLPHPHVNFYFARSPVIHFFILSFSACPCVFLSTIPGVFCTGFPSFRIVCTELFTVMYYSTLYNFPTRLLLRIMERLFKNSTSFTFLSCASLLILPVQ